MSRQARTFLVLVCLLGSVVMVYGAWNWRVDNIPKLAAYIITAMLASRLKVGLPEVTGSMSVNFLFILIGVAELNFSETLVLGCCAILAQCVKRKGRWPRPEQVAFNLAASSIAVWLAYFTYHGPLHSLIQQGFSLLLVLAACVYFVANTLPVATIIALTENKKLRRIWSDCYFWAFPYYLVGAAVAGLVSWLNQKVGWQPTLLALPAMFVIYRSYRLYLAKLADEKHHVAEVAALHLRTIEALALAIEAKDQSTHDHLERVRVYAIEIAKILGLPNEEMEALRAAALLHDIGKLAVPEHIIAKPGRLTPEEFEKMKIHPIVGAEILERVKFPYPVVPIVRSHHERWDGTGYPDGLAGEQIPIGARILSAVDCLDALASDRVYRKAIPLEEAMRWVAEQSGKAYDPKVVQLLQKNYQRLEELVRGQVGSAYRQKLSTAFKVERGRAPANGFQVSTDYDPANQASFLQSIAAARKEAQTLFELTQDLGTSLSLSDTLSALSEGLKKLVPYDTMAVYILRDGQLTPGYVSGDNLPKLASLSIPAGAGVSGWVAHNRQPIVNGNPEAEPGYRNDPGDHAQLRSTISVPLQGLQNVVGALTLYHSQADTYTSDHVRILLAIAPKVAHSVENALAFQEAESSATTDYLTELPNARSLFLHLDRELARCKRLDTPITVMVCDLDGFKRVNDSYGHLEGNRILKLFAKTLQGSCREYDYIARMGGDEFVIVAPGLSAAAAEAKGICLSELARVAGREVCGEDWLSLSVGCAFYPQDGDEAEKLLAEADRRMYLQKQERKDLTHINQFAAGIRGPALSTKDLPGKLVT
jgi:diguanylate cyclase (GGDEF)-like protein/putative nucleotidyltransferase with HDIG domain